ncbi:ATP-binding region ATPase domain protein [Gemmatirosa kalamazoonensis]|uniref:histidine kinase n=1 Tax=Gemmatirosa kalamazoonensis TaxID=861299 RepID=W0RF82_9BACT|nr:HAMP domain-containing sensor histidine kinase [Gemmatirosa kalamazoonensis]AHG89102.1 ATP-binding region ATPase domain protein [Gemmatirosa kalamazoonensis]
MTVLAPIAPLPYAPHALTAVVFVGGALVGVAATAAARWGARQARTARAVAEAAGQLVVVRPIDGGPCTPICVPPALASLLAPGDHSADVLPPWRPEVAAAVEALRARVAASPSQSATLDWPLSDRRLRLVGARIGDGAQLLVSLAEAGPDAARYNQLESAALLSSGVAHDLMNVLNRLVMHAELGADRARVPEVRTHFGHIHSGSVRASELVTLMRRYLRGERTAAAERVPVAPAAIVEEVVELLRPSMPRGISLSLALDPSCVVLAEPVHVHQIVLNVVTNAAQALEGHPAPRVTITVAPVGGAVELVVSDNGPGLPAAVRERLFEPYVTSRAARGGTGLGLAVVRTIVTDVLGGAVEAGDAPGGGGGARFVIRLPSATTMATAARRDALEAATAGR